MWFSSKDKGLVGVDIPSASVKLIELVEDDAFIQELHYRYQDKLQSA